MNEQLKNMMAEIESWESATEFGIPEDMWAGYQVRRRADDLYIGILSELFDTLRIEDVDARNAVLSELAKTLLVYSRSTATKYLNGVSISLNLLYCAATFYLANFPATATFLARKINLVDDFNDVESFLFHYLSRSLNENHLLDNTFLNILNNFNDESSYPFIELFEESKKLGLENDPRLFIASQLTLEVLSRYRAYNVWDCLRANIDDYDGTVWEPFLVSDGSFPIWELFPSQMVAVESGILSDSNDVYSMQMPTSSGKTSLCELIIYNEVKCRAKKVLFLVPFRALASEIKEGISKRLQNAGISVVASHGGNIPSRSEGVSAETADVLIVTPEKYAALVQSSPELEERFNTIICDEGHLIDDGTRGLQYELLLTKLIAVGESNKKLIFISAILPNVSEIHSWLGGQERTLAKSEYKPVECDFSFITPQTANSWQLEFNTIYQRPRSYFLRSFLNQDDFRYLNPNTGRQNLVANYKSYTSLACAAALKARRNGPVALFTTMKSNNGISGLALKLISMCDLAVNVAREAPILSENLPRLIDYMSFQLGESYLLTRLLRYGFGFHHGDLPQEIRREMEGAIQGGVIDILLCTSTLAEGVNLPIRTLVVHTIKRFDGDSLVPIPQRSIKNIVGRVGRAGKETRGRIIFANNEERGVVENVFRDSQMEAAYGSLFSLVRNLNQAVSSLNIQLSNEIFESQNVQFLSIIDRIDVALLDLIPQEVLVADIENYVERAIERTLAYQYADTDELRARVKEIFLLRTRHLQAQVPREQWPFLKNSGASPRFWRYVNEANLLDRVEWQSLSEVESDVWLNEIVLSTVDMPTAMVEYDLVVLKQAVKGWMRGLTYSEISQSCNTDIEETLKLVGHTIGFQIQDGFNKLTQMAISKYGEEELSEISRNWSSLLQFGLGNLQQLDLFDRGATDRLGVWGISRFLSDRNIDLRGQNLVRFLRRDAAGVLRHLDMDERVPSLSKERICSELRIEG